MAHPADSSPSVQRSHPTMIHSCGLKTIRLHIPMHTGVGFVQAAACLLTFEHRHRNGISQYVVNIVSLSLYRIEMNSDIEASPAQSADLYNPHNHVRTTSSQNQRFPPFPAYSANIRVEWAMLFASTACKEDREHHQRRLLISIYLRRMWLSVSRPQPSRSLFDLQSSSAIRHESSTRRYGRQQTKSLPYVIYNRIQTSTTGAYIDRQLAAANVSAACCSVQCSSAGPCPPPADRRSDVTLSFRIFRRDKLTAASNSARCDVASRKSHSHNDVK